MTKCQNLHLYPKQLYTVEAEDTREAVDIVKLNAEIAEIVLKQQKLRSAIDEIIKEIEHN